MLKVTNEELEKLAEEHVPIPYYDADGSQSFYACPICVHTESGVDCVVTRLIEAYNELNELLDGVVRRDLGK